MFVRIHHSTQLGIIPSVYQRIKFLILSYNVHFLIISTKATLTQICSKIYNLGLHKYKRFIKS